MITAILLVLFSLHCSSGFTPKRPVQQYNDIVNFFSRASAPLLTGLIAPQLLRVAQVRAADTMPTVTDRVKIDIKIANYTEESVGTNKGAEGSGTIVIGLYGKHAPQSVKLFLDTVMGDGIDTPDYYNAQFQRVTPQGLLEMDSVRGMNAISIAGSSQYEYRGKIMSAYKPILESPDDGLLLHHDRMGLLTHRQLSSTPEFGITLKDDPSRADVEELDAFHCVFGEVIEGRAVLEAIAAIPLYTYETKTGYAGGEKGVESALADKWFAAQRNFYVNMGKSLGDDRAVDMRGKLLKRTVVKKVTKL